MFGKLKRHIRLTWTIKELWITTILAAWATGRGAADVITGNLFGIISIVLGLTTYIWWRRNVQKYMKLFKWESK